MEFINKLILLLSGQGLVLSYFIYKKKQSRANRFVSIYILVFSGILLYWYFAFWDPSRSPYAIVFRGDITLQLFLGPLLYLILNSKAKTRDHMILPTVLAIAFMTIWFWMYYSIATSPTKNPQINYNFFLYTNLIGLVLSLWYALRCRTHLKSSLSTLLLITLVIYLLGWLVTHVMFLIGAFYEWLDYFTVLLEIVAFYGAGYFLLIDERKKVNYELDHQELSTLMPKITNFMQAEKPFLDAGFNIKEMSDQLNLHSKKLSQVLNQGFNQSFTEHINTYRIEEAKRLLTNERYQKHTVLEILLECGFNSKSAFNSAFKKFTGKSPLEFKKSINKV